MRTSSTQTVIVTLTPQDPRAEPRTMAEHADQFRRDLRALGAEPGPAPTPDDLPVQARGDWPAALAVVVQVAALLPDLLAVTGYAQAWLARGAGRRVRLAIDGQEIDLTAATAAQQEALVAAYLARVTGGVGK